MLPTLGVEEGLPIEATSALGTARLGQSSKVVLAAWTAKVLCVDLPIRRAPDGSRALRSKGNFHSWSLTENGGRRSSGGSLGRHWRASRQWHMERTKGSVLTIPGLPEEERRAALRASR